MRKLLGQIETWLNNNQSVALATVIKTWGSSPRPVGAGMAVTQDGEINGSVSGGCVEGAVIDAALEVIKSNKPKRLHFGVADSDAWQVGLACGGEIDVFVRNFDISKLNVWKTAFQTNQQFYSILRVKGAGDLLGEELLILNDGSIINQGFPSDQVELLKNSIQEEAVQGKAVTTVIKNDLGEIFYQLIQTPPTLIIVGGVHIAVHLAKLAEILGFEVIVIDPRRLFGAGERFPGVKQVINDWPGDAFQKIQIDQSTAIVMLTHDPKIDDPALKMSLSSPAFYIGALGSKKTHAKRLDRLSADGIDIERLNIIHAPVGLDLGGKLPEEIALAIIAEIVKTRNLS
ncbi:MAG: XdhC family protein [Anaerolineales bacterium]|nr:XdhC family protein [Anaerolineales bacterium]